MRRLCDVLFSHIRIGVKFRECQRLLNKSTSTHLTRDISFHVEDRLNLDELRFMYLDGGDLLC